MGRRKQRACLDAMEHEFQPNKTELSAFSPSVRFSELKFYDLRRLVTASANPVEEFEF